MNFAFPDSYNLHFYLVIERNFLFLSKSTRASTRSDAIRTAKKWLSYIHDVNLHFKFV